ncbi:hypothetical protein ASG85_35930 [Paenibacillus sp. Soil724D2]|nr:hypothetical protein ASG85_35930 [Paenibacillus sp. Soil724D2]
MKEIERASKIFKELQRDRKSLEELRKDERAHPPCALFGFLGIVYIFESHSIELSPKTYLEHSTSTL